MGRCSAMEATDERVVRCLRSSGAGGRSAAGRVV